MLSLLPEQYSTRIKDYKSEGLFYIKGRYEYSLQSKSKFTANFGIEKAMINYVPGNESIEELNVKGRIHLDAKNTELDIEKLNFKLGQDQVQAEFYIKDFAHPEVNLNAEANLHLENIIRFYPIDTLEKLSGEVKLKLVFNGLWEKLRENATGKDIQLQTKTEIKDLELQFKNDPNISKLPACTLFVMDGEVELKNCKILRGTSDLLLNGKVPRLFEYLNDRSKNLIIYGDLNSSHLKLEDFMMKYYSSTSKNQAIIPSNMVFKLDAKIGAFEYGNFKATQISGDIEIKNQKAIASDVKLKVMEGEAEIDAYFD